MSVNLILACLAGGLVSVVTRIIWFHPSVFGNHLNKKGGRNNTTVLVASFLICAFLCYSMKWVNHPDDLNFVLHGMYHGVMNVGVFAVGAVLIHSLAEHKSTQYTLVHAGYWLVTFALMAATLTAFPPFK